MAIKNRRVALREHAERKKQEAEQGAGKFNQTQQRTVKLQG